VWHPQIRVSVAVNVSRSLSSVLVSLGPSVSGRGERRSRSSAGRSTIDPDDSRPRVTLTWTERERESLCGPAFAETAGLVQLRLLQPAVLLCLPPDCSKRRASLQRAVGLKETPSSRRTLSPASVKRNAVLTAALTRRRVSEASTVVRSRRAHPVTGSTTCTLETCSGASMDTMPPSCCGVRLTCFFTCLKTQPCSRDSPVVRSHQVEALHNDPVLVAEHSRDSANLALVFARDDLHLRSCRETARERSADALLALSPLSIFHAVNSFPKRLLICSAVAKLRGGPSKLWKARLEFSFQLAPHSTSLSL